MDVPRRAFELRERGGRTGYLVLDDEARDFDTLSREFLREKDRRELAAKRRKAAEDVARGGKGS